MQRFGRIARLRAGMESSYDRYHAQVWPTVLAAIEAAGIRHYSIYRHEQWLFSYFELPDGLSLEEVTSALLQERDCLKWEELMKPLQEPVPGAECYWTQMKEVFHVAGTSR